MFETPILFICFNRLECTKRVFEVIRTQRPHYLYVSADGPREEREGEKEICNQVRKYILDNIDWNCDLRTLFRDQNLGCGKAVSSAITWFFENVEEGIILEDDCLPASSFFKYCSELLERYRNTNYVFVISGNNFQNKMRGSSSYYFSAYGHTWGWASWSHAWGKFKYSLDTITEFEFNKCLMDYFYTKQERDYWNKVFIMMKYNPIDTWDFQWLFFQWLNKGISILPNTNLVSNIGFNENATHTFTYTDGISAKKSFEITSLEHPLNFQINRKADLYTFMTVFSESEPNFFTKLSMHFNNSVFGFLSSVKSKK